jgi:hypothetical protein
MGGQSAYWPRITTSENCAADGCETPEAVYLYIMVIGAIVLCAWGILTFIVIGLHIEQTEGLENYEGIDGAPARSACFKGESFMKRWIRDEYYTARLDHHKSA